MSSRLNCGTYDGDEEEIMSAEVTHIVADLEDSIHTKVGTPDITRAPIILISLVCSHQSR